MKTVVITGSARGFGYEMLKVFRKNNFNCVICDVNKDILEDAKNNLENMKYEGKVLCYQVDVTKKDTIDKIL